MLDRKRDNKESENSNILEAINAPNVLANLTTGMDVFPIDINKLIPAPIQWNFYGELPAFKMEELIDSIRVNGLLHPLVVWQQPNDTYMILSGHCRKNAIQYLLKEFTNNKDLEIAADKAGPPFHFEFISELVKSKKIHCYVKKFDELDEDMARSIIVDTNWVQRELSTRDKSRSILYRYTQLGRKARTTNGESTNEKARDAVALHFAISGRQVSKYIRLNYLIPEFAELLNSNHLSIASGVILSEFSKETQLWILDNYGKVLSNKNINKLKKTMTKPEIIQVLLSRSTTKIDLTISEMTLSKEKNDALFNNYVDAVTNEDLIINTIKIPIDKQYNFKIAMLRFFKENNMQKI